MTADRLYSLAHVTRRGGSRGGGRLSAVTRWSMVLVLVAACVVGGFVLVEAHGRGDLNDFLCEGPCGPEQVAAPADLSAPDPAGAAVSDLPGAAADPAAVEQAVSAALADPALGPSVGVSVRDLATGESLVETTSAGLVPASTTKVLTGFAALSLLDPDERFTTRTVLSAGTLVLVGGGDPFLVTSPDQRGFAARADLVTLADRTVTALTENNLTATTLAWDASLFSGPADNPAWERSYVAEDIVTPTSALWVDRGAHSGRRDDDPAATAAATFANLLAQRGVAVTLTGPTSADAAAQSLASVSGGTVRQVVERTELASDNEAAEVLLRHVGLAAGGDGSTEAGVAAVRELLSAEGIDVSGLELNDGSGLSRVNAIPPGLLTAVIARADEATPSLLADLPVARFSGSLEGRFGRAPGGGLVRAKTGTLSGVHSLAGTVTTADGVVLAVAALTDGTEGPAALATQAALDALVGSLASCACAAD